MRTHAQTPSFYVCSLLRAALLQLEEQLLQLMRIGREEARNHTSSDVYCARIELCDADGVAADVGDADADTHAHHTGGHLLELTPACLHALHVLRLSLAVSQLMLGQDVLRASPSLLH